MKIESLKKSKIFYTIIITLIILCSLGYYFVYYRNLPQYADKNSPEYTANMFFSKIKNSKPGERNGEEICDMIYFKGTSGFVDFEEMMKVYYSKKFYFLLFFINCFYNTISTKNNNSALY